MAEKILELLSNLTHDMKSYLSVIESIVTAMQTTSLTDEQQSMLNLLYYTTTLL